MTSSAAAHLDIRPLAAAVGGPVLAPGEDGWDAARQAWNVLADQQPAAVVFATEAADVVEAVRFARDNGLRVAAQGTGHAATALGPLTDTVLVKTVRMGGVEIDPSARRARVEAGVLWGDLAVAAAEQGLAGLGGSSPDVGVVGYSLGGGIGWLTRKYGLAGNSIVSAEVVTADGELVRADSHNHADLFWALRGGGGSFGVVTALELELQPVAQVYAGSLMWPAEHSAEILHAYREWAAGVPEELTSGVRLLCLPPIPEVPEPLRGRPMVDVTAAFLGGAEEASELLAPLRAVAEPMIDSMALMPASGLSHIYGDPEQPTPGMTNQTLLSELSSEGVDTLVEVAGAQSGSPLLMVALRHLGGAARTAPVGAGALAKVDAEYALYGVGVPMAPEMAPAIEGHLDLVISRMAPWSTGRDYLNLADRPGDASNAFGQDTYARLREIRAAVDPRDMFVSSHPVR